VLIRYNTVRNSSADKAGEGLIGRISVRGIKNAPMAKTVLPKTSMTNHTPTHDEIAAQAYQIYLREGGEGRDMEHWLQAEAELRAGAMNGNGNGNGQPSAAGASATEPGSTTSRTRENILPNSVVPPTAPITQVAPQPRANTPRKGSGKREPAAATR
jgi:hypothetical protein